MPAASSAASQSPVHAGSARLHAVVGGEQDDGVVEQAALVDQVEPGAEPRVGVAQGRARRSPSPGPPAWWPESVSVVFHQVSRGGIVLRATGRAPARARWRRPASPTRSRCSRHVLLRRDGVVDGRRQRPPTASRCRLAGLADEREGAVRRSAVDGLVDAGAVGARRQPLEDRAHARAQPVRRPVPRRRGVRDDLLAGAAVEEGVVNDAVAPGADAGERARVVHQRDARELGDRAAPQRAAALEQPGDVRQGPVGGQRQQLGRRRAVPQQADDVPGAGCGRGPAGRRPSRRRRRRPGAPASRRRRRCAPPRRRTPRARTPAPDSSSGARDCTPLSEPCSPRWPPRSGQ